MIFKKAIQRELIKNDPTQFVILQKKKKTIEQLKEQDIPKYIEKEELALFLETAVKHGLELDFPVLTVENRMQRLLKLAGLNETPTPHSLRHTQSLLAEAEVVVEDIMERLGHTEDDTTRIIYYHVIKEMKKASHKFTQLMRSLH